MFPVSRLAFCATVLLACSAPEAARVSSNDGGTLVLVGGTVVDGRGGAPIEDATVVIEGDRIVRIDAESLTLAEWLGRDSVTALDVTGKFLIPGLIDTHVHLATSPDRPRALAHLRRLLYAGVTSVRDMAGDARFLADIARAARLDEIEAPDVYYSALMAGPSFLDDPRPRSSARGEIPGRVPWMQAITPETDMPLAVAMAKGTFATGIKIYANLPAFQVQRITAEAHRQNMRVWTHSMVFPARPLAVIQADVDVISHACRLAWEAVPDAPGEYHHGRVPDYTSFSAGAPVFARMFEEMTNRGTILDATLALYAQMDAQRERDPESGPPIRCDTEFARDLVRTAHAAGVLISTGTDFPTPRGDAMSSLHVEIEELVANGGFGPAEVITAATLVGAMVLGIEASHGTLEASKIANAVVLDRNPLVDIRNLRSVFGVVKNGRFYRRSTVD